MNSHDEPGKIVHLPTAQHMHTEHNRIEHETFASAITRLANTVQIHELLLTKILRTQYGALGLSLITLISVLFLYGR